MAAGDMKWFAQALHDLGNKVHDLDGDTLKLAFIKTATTPTIDTAAPHWGGTGTTDMSTNKVAETGTSYTSAHITLGSKVWQLVTGGAQFRAAVVNLAQDASGFTDARWGIIYNSTDANKRCIGYLDLGSDRSLVTGALNVDWNGANNDILQITQS